MLLQRMGRGLVARQVQVVARQVHNINRRGKPKEQHLCLTGEILYGLHPVKLMLEARQAGNQLNARTLT